MINARAVGRESKAEKSRRFLEIVRRLEKAMPEAKIALQYQDQLQLLVSVMLSAQCTDQRKCDGERHQDRQFELN